MGKTFSLLLACILLLAATPTLGQEIDQNKLTVYGKVRVFAKADRATITFEIKGEGKSLTAAFDQARNRIDTVAQQLQAIGLEDKALATSFFRSTENFGKKAFLSSKRDYKATMTATITTDKLELLESVVTILSESNIESIDDIQFSLVEYQKIRQDALAQAVIKAREKADLICTQLEIERGEVIEVEELRVEKPTLPSFSTQRYYNPFNAPFMQVRANADHIDDEGATAIYPREIQFDSEVRVVFALGK